MQLLAADELPGPLDQVDERGTRLRPQPDARALTPELSRPRIQLEVPECIDGHRLLLNQRPGCARASGFPQEDPSFRWNFKGMPRKAQGNTRESQGTPRKPS
jgi:hypothetical protein